MTRIETLDTMRLEEKLSLINMNIQYKRTDKAFVRGRVLPCYNPQICLFGQHSGGCSRYYIRGSLSQFISVPTLDKTYFPTNMSMGAMVASTLTGDVRFEIASLKCNDKIFMAILTISTALFIQNL